mmetsp:Transcript_18298/g.31320  ORF Transcript_18298/g.31320 Transcript_18298/m.31320 type:complete len:82 (-) Transcript_18298:948-1193(-)
MLAPCYWSAVSHLQCQPSATEQRLAMEHGRPSPIERQVWKRSSCQQHHKTSFHRMVRLCRVPKAARVVLCHSSAYLTDQYR